MARSLLAFRNGEHGDRPMPFAILLSTFLIRAARFLEPKG
jgi:hypothetical protein